jgi:hypothetical protein
MVAAKLIEMIEIHASQLSHDIATELITNEQTRGFRVCPLEELTPRLFQIIHHLGDWIGDPRSVQVKDEFMMWGARRFDQRIPLRELVYGTMLFKQHLRRYIADNGVIAASLPSVESDYVLPMHLLSLQELNATVNQFFDEAVYYLVCGYEDAASNSHTPGHGIAAPA